MGDLKRVGRDKGPTGPRPHFAATLQGVGTTLQEIHAEERSRAAAQEAPAHGQASRAAAQQAPTQHRASHVAAQEAAATHPSPRRPALLQRHKRFVRALGIVVLLGVGGLLSGALYTPRESTDAAQVEGHVALVSTRVAGKVKSIAVVDNQMVAEGALLLELEPEELQGRRDLARAELEAARAAVAHANAQLVLLERTAAAIASQARAGYQQAQLGVSSAQLAIRKVAAELAGVRATLAARKIDYERVSSLHLSGAAPGTALEAGKLALDAAATAETRASAQLAMVRADAASSRDKVSAAQGLVDQTATVQEQLAVARGAREIAAARVLQAQAALALAELNLSHTRINAPIAGRISRRTVEVGQVVSPERPLLALASEQEAWVVANFKETQVARLRPKQQATVDIDAYDEPIEGVVDSIAGTSGARFSLLPPDNASGNFVKVVQRIPVVIRIVNAHGRVLRPGMNAVVTVHVD